MITLQLKTARCHPPAPPSLDEIYFAGNIRRMRAAQAAMAAGFRYFVAVRRDITEAERSIYNFYPVWMFAGDGYRLTGWAWAEATGQLMWVGVEE